MALTDGIWQPGYAMKSAVKIFFFLGLPLFVLRKEQLSNFFGFKKKMLPKLVALGLGIFAFILAAYFIIGPYFDFSSVVDGLQDQLGVNASNFIYVATYISFVNSLLEEYFFRGIAFIELKRCTSKRFAYVFSALMFALYHVAMLIGLFDWYLIALMLLALVVGGFIFNYINEKEESILASWTVHLFANLAINTVGLLLFGIL
ncbi:MAG: CPBP family intramembrane metalloprotease [Firmicutes bacterium HGW-Firmicutes-19]|nr:MAG: CPBP family intramembrane metalloprotease [Firmicutes bacterium HGW-Firmicutes-19]